MQGPDHYVRVPLGNKQLLLHGSIIHHVPEDAAIGAIGRSSPFGSMLDMEFHVVCGSTVLVVVEW